ncbi:MAG: hypothetical protein ACOCXG_03480 [Nanoarchaeota archaeon]
MALDIDSFLETYSGEEKNPKEKEESNKKISLDFQKDVEDKLSKTVADYENNNDFKFLKSVYEEVKKFDEDLTNKFMGLEKKGSEALEQISKKYSTEYIQNLKIQKQQTIEIVSKHIENIKANLEAENLFDTLKRLKGILTQVSQMPQELIEEKINFQKTCLQIETEILDKIENYKSQFIPQKKRQLSELNKDLILNANKLNSEELTKKINAIHEELEAIPEYLETEFIKEKITLNKNLVLAENYLEKLHNAEFLQKENLINSEIENFHKSYLNKNLQKTLMTYDNIVLIFTTIPEIQIEKRVEIYNKLNDLYSKVNNLVLKNNVALFMGTYHYSQALQEINSYIDHIKRTQTYDNENLHLIQEKIKSLPERFEQEKSRLRGELNYLLKHLNPQHAQTEKDSIKPAASQDFNQENPKTSNAEKRENTTKNISLNTKKSDVKAEIEKYFEIIKEEKDPQKLKIAYKKIVFYIDLLEVSKEEKENLASKVKNLITHKNLS